MKNSRNRVVAIQQTNGSPHEHRRTRFLQQQMLILMFTTLILFFITTFPVAIFRFAMSTLGVQQSFSLSLLLAAIFGVITASNYAFNFYLHCLTSKLFRKEFMKSLPCTISIRFGHSNQGTVGTATQRGVILRETPGTITQLMGKLSNTHAVENNRVTTV